MSKKTENTTETIINQTEADMAQDYSTSPDAATLTQAELFTRFLEAKLRVNAMQSTLIKEPELPAATAEEWFVDWHGCASVCFEHDFAERMLDELRVCEDPEAELETAVGDLETLLEGIKFLQREFRAVCDQTRTEPPEDDAPDEVFRDWENSPRYVLPVIEVGEAIKITARIIVDEAREDLAAQAA